ncbi:hypothetical protein ACFQZ2_23750, partial [Streptomonospora algeriensis]
GRADGPGHLTDAEVWVDPAEWHSLVQAVSDAADRLHAAARAPHTPGTIPTSTTLVMFALASAATGGGDAAADEDR